MVQQAMNRSSALAEEHELFAAGDMVEWREQDTAERKDVLSALRRDYGSGPYRVERVRQARDEAKASHPQVVYVKFKELPESVALAGSWFKHVRH